MKTTIAKYYNLENIIELQKLNGYNNENYLVRTEQKKYILKIYNFKPKLNSKLDAENDILLFLSSSMFGSISQPIKNKNGNYITEFEINNEKKIIRILTFVAGTLFTKVIHTETLFESLGNFLANMDLKLLTYKNKTIQIDKSEWNNTNINSLIIII